MSRPRAFTLIDLCVVCVFTLFLFSLLVPNLISGSREVANRIKCSSNLRTIGLAMKMYANDEFNNFPRTLYVPGDPPTAWTNPDSPNPFLGSNSPAPNDVTAAAFLNLRTQDIIADVFICPISQADRFAIGNGKTIQDYSNFRNQGELSYSFQNPYATPAAEKKGFVYNDSLPGDFALVADINPGEPALLTTPKNAPPAQLRMLNSPNHEYDGQNVLYADGHVDWCTSPFVGVNNDNIYTYGPTPPEAYPGSTNPIGIIGSPIDGNDSVLLPIWDPTFPMPGRATTIAFRVVVISAALLTLAAGGIVYLCFTRRRRAAQ